MKIPQNPPCVGDFMGFPIAMFEYPRVSQQFHPRISWNTICPSSASPARSQIHLQRCLAQTNSPLFQAFSQTILLGVKKGWYPIGWMVYLYLYGMENSRKWMIWVVPMVSPWIGNLQSCWSREVPFTGGNLTSKNQRVECFTDMIKPENINQNQCVLVNNAIR